MNTSRIIKSVIIIALGTGCLVFGYNFLGGIPLFSTQNKYHAVYKHSVGLQKGSSVTANGVNIGTVSDIRLDEKNGRVVVSFIENGSFKFSKNSQAEIYSTLMGGSGLQLIPAFDNAPLAQNGDTLPSLVQRGLMDIMSTSAEPTMQRINGTLISADSLLQTMSATLDKKSQADIKQSLSHLNSTLQHLSRATAQIDALLLGNKQSIDVSLKNLEKITANFSQFSNNIQHTNLSQTIQNLEQTIGRMDKILSEVEKGEGALGKLLKQPELYNNIQTASSELGLLLEDIRRNPKRYLHISVFGKKQSEYATPQSVEPSISERKEMMQEKK